jgi:hypothetical protein
MAGCSNAFYWAERGARAVGIEAGKAIQWPAAVHFNPTSFSWKRRAWGARACYWRGGGDGLWFSMEAWSEGERCSGWPASSGGDCLGATKKKGGWLGLMGQKGQLGESLLLKKRKIGWVAWWAGPNTEKEKEICFRIFGS